MFAALVTRGRRVNNKRILGFSVFLTFAIVSAALAIASPTKSFVSASTGSEMSLWFYLSYLELSESLVVCAFLVLLFPTVSPERSSSGTARKVGLALALLGGAAWVFKAVDNLFVPSSYILGSPLFSSVLNGTRRISAGLPGIAGVLALLIATFGFALFESGSGMPRALLSAIQTYAAPLLLFQQVTLLLYSPLAMVDHATNLLRLWEGGFQPASNWLALLVSLLMTSMAVANSRRPREK